MENVLDNNYRNKQDISNFNSDFNEPDNIGILYNTLFEIASDAVLLISDMKIKKCSRNSAQLFDYTMEELLDKSLLDISAEYQKDKLKSSEMLNTIFNDKQTEGNNVFNWIFITKQKINIITEITYKSINIAGSSYSLLIIRDISKRIKSETEKSKSEIRFSEFADLVPQLLFELDTRGNISYINQPGIQLFGYEDENIEELNAFSLIIPEDHPKLLDNLKKLESGFKSVGNEYTAIHRSGKKFTVLIFASPVFENQKLVGFRGVLLDISNRKQIETSLMRSEERYRSIVENSHDAILIINDSFKIIYTNKEATILFGMEREELVNNDFRNMLYKDSVELVKERYLRRRKGEDVPARYEFKIVRKNGEIRDVELSSSVVHQDSAQNIISIAQLLDITERKQNRRKLKQRLKIEKIISKISSRFIGLYNHDIAINKTLAELGNFSNAGRAYLFKIHESGKQISNTHEWTSKGVQPEIDNLQNIDIDLVPWWMEQHRQGKNIYIKDCHDMPEEASNEQELLLSQNIKTLLALPVFAGERLYGFIGFDFLDEIREWEQADISILRACSEIIGNAIERSGFEKELQIMNIELEKRVQHRTNELEKTMKELKTEIKNRQQTLIELETLNNEINDSREALRIKAERLALLNKKLLKSEKELNRYHSKRNKFKSLSTKRRSEFYKKTHKNNNQ